MTKYNEQLLQNFLSSPCDYRGEVFAAEFIWDGEMFDNLYFKTISSFKRSSSKDIASIKLDVKENGSEQLLIELNREGLYDMLPEGIFHFKTGKSKKDKETILEDIKKAIDEESQARKFFGPFENEFFQLRLQSELKKRELLQLSSTESNKDFFETLYGKSAHLNNYQILALLYLLPMAHKIRGDVEKISYCFTILIQHETKVTLVNKYVLRKIEVEMNALGKIQLGINSIAGSSFSQQEIFYNILIKDVKKEGLISFFPEGVNYSMINYIAGFLFPAESDYCIELQLNKDDRQAFLSDNKNEVYLGFNTFI